LFAHDPTAPSTTSRTVSTDSPSSFVAAGALVEVHEQAMRRLTEVTGLIPVEYPTFHVSWIQV
jgi:hypothetical protein